MKSILPYTPVRICTYNVLSSSLADPSYYVNNRPEFLDQEYRLNSLIKKMDKEIENNAVICLQEVSQKWAGKLYPYFLSKGYLLICGLYGNRFNGYMGVGVATPVNKFDVVEVDITKISDTKRLPKVMKLTGLALLLQNIKSWFLKWLEYLKLYTPPFDVWDNALYRNNQMISVRLQSKETSQKFVVGTYHMPCMFQHPQVMVIHTALSTQHIAKFAGNDPYVYCGDFNMKPDSSMYQLVTTGKLDKKNPDVPENKPTDSWSPKLTAPMVSAYQAGNGKEPVFTNYAQTKDGDRPFIDTLDYIFLSTSKETGKPAWVVHSTTPLPTQKDVGGPMPVETEPSDHLLLSAELRLL